MYTSTLLSAAETNFTEIADAPQEKQYCMLESRHACKEEILTLVKAFLTKNNILPETALYTSLLTFNEELLENKQGKIFALYKNKQLCAILPFVRSSFVKTMFPNISYEYLLCLNTFNIQRFSVMYLSVPIILTDDEQEIQTLFEQLELYAQSNSYSHIFTTISDSLDIFPFEKNGFIKNPAKGNIFYWHKKI